MPATYLVEVYGCFCPPWQSPALTADWMLIDSTKEADYLVRRSAQGWELVSVVPTQWAMMHERAAMQVLERAFYWRAIRPDMEEL